MESSHARARIALITDLHLGPQADYTLNGVNVQDTLEQVLAGVSARSPDRVVATGDLADHGQRKAYERLRSLLGRLDCPVRVVPGNHDDPETLAASLCDEQVRWQARDALAGWELLLLDSCVPGQPGGRLAQSALEELESGQAGPPALAFVHHQPVPVGSAWIDAMMLENGAALIAALPARTRALFFGHVHQNFHAMAGDLAILGSASTCYQIRPGLDTFALDPDSRPAWREIELGVDGQWRTAVWHAC